MSDAACFREQAARAQRLLNATTDRLTQERLAALAEEYETKARALEVGLTGTPPETM
jgi:hypothetical protein